MRNGLPFSSLQRDGVPVGNFWQKVQQRYADMFGSRLLTTVGRRKDAGTKRKLPNERGGKETATSFKRRRLAALRQEPRIPFGPETQNVFGYTAVTSAKLRRLQEQEATDTFKKILDKAKKTQKKKKQAHLALSSGGPAARLCQLSLKKQKEVKRKEEAKWNLFGKSCIAGEVKWTWRTLMRSMGGAGDPWFYLERGVADTLQGRGLDEEFRGKPLRALVCNDIAEYVRSCKAPLRRIIIIRTLSAVPWELEMAAHVLGARVQQRVLVPMLQRCRDGGEVETEGR